MRKILLILTVLIVNAVAFSYELKGVNRVEERKICFENDEKLKKFTGLKYINKKHNIKICYPYLVLKGKPDLEVIRKIRYLNSYIEDYTKKLAIGGIKELNESVKDLSEIFKLEYFLDYKVGLINSDIFSMYFDETIFLGGAHHIYNFEYITIDLNKRKRLSFYDVFKKEKESLLRKILLKLDKDNEVIWKNDRKYFLKDRAPLNFYLTENYIIFTFQPYEYAPFVAGYREIKVEPQILMELMNKNSVVYKYYFKNMDR